MADPNDKGKVPQGALAEAVKKGAQVGVSTSVQRQPQPVAQPLVEKPMEMTEATNSAINDILVAGLVSDHREPKLDAIKLAGEVGGPEIAGKLALSAVCLNGSSFDSEIQSAVVASLTKLLKRTGARAFDFIIQEGMNPVEYEYGSSTRKTVLHYQAIAEAVGEAGLAEGLHVLNLIMKNTDDSTIQGAVMKALKKIAGVST